MKYLSLFGILLASILHCPVYAILLTPDGIGTIVPTGSNDTTAPYTDDLLLDTITFGGITFSADLGQIIAVSSVYVVSGRNNINAEWGDNDTSSDDNPIPFERFGLDPLDQESQDPTIQDLALASAFSTNSLTEGSDGEGGGTSVFRVTFSSGISDNNPADDLVPEIVLFERGNNDTTTLRAITGGTYLNPTYATTTVTIGSGDMWGTGLQIDTTEINSSQELASIGIDLSDFGATGTIFGLEITTNGGDLSGIFGSIQSSPSSLEPVPEVLNNPLGTVPEPTTSAFLLGFYVLVLVVCTRRKRAI